MNKQDPEAIVNVLNEAVALDRDAMQNLCSYRVPVNEALAEHPTIQVGMDNSLSFTGLLNGICGGEFFIAQQWEEAGKNNQEEFLGFVLIEAKECYGKTEA